MESTTQSDGATANNTEDEEYPNVNGEPLSCPECGQYVVVVHRSGHKYGAYDAGFYLQCDCAFGGKLGRDVTEDFWGGWIADRVDDDMLDFYLHDELAENWRGDDDE
jgi:hypothetical protein